jgi:xylose isomerase
MKAVPPNEQQALVERLTKACGGAYSPETRRKYFISGPQWAAAYQGQALFFAPTRKAITYEDVIRELGKVGVGYWTTHDSDVIPAEHLGTDRQKEIIGNIQKTLQSNDVKCSMVTTETFYHEVFAAGPAAESPEIREYSAFRVRNTVDIGHELGASYAVYWPGSLGYLTQGAI